MNLKHKRYLWRKAVTRLVDDKLISGLSRELALNSELTKCVKETWHLTTGVEALAAPQYAERLQTALRQFIPLVQVIVRHGKTSSVVSDDYRAAAAQTDSILARLRNPQS